MGGTLDATVAPCASVENTRLHLPSNRMDRWNEKNTSETSTAVWELIMQQRDGHFGDLTGMDGDQTTLLNDWRSLPKYRD